MHSERTGNQRLSCTRNSCYCMPAPEAAGPRCRTMHQPCLMQRKKEKQKWTEIIWKKHSKFGLFNKIPYRTLQLHISLSSQIQTIRCREPLVFQVFHKPMCLTGLYVYFVLFLTYWMKCYSGVTPIIRILLGQSIVGIKIARVASTSSLTSCLAIRPLPPLGSSLPCYYLPIGGFHQNQSEAGTTLAELQNSKINKSTCPYKLTFIKNALL